MDVVQVPKQNSSKFPSENEPSSQVDEIIVCNLLIIRCFFFDFEMMRCHGFCIAMLQKHAPALRNENFLPNLSEVVMFLQI